MEILKTKPKIAWITADHFVDCDFDLDRLRFILKEFDIFWFIVLPSTNARFEDKDFEGLNNIAGLTVEIFQLKNRAKNPKNIFSYWQLKKNIKKIHADLIYFNEVPVNPFILPLYYWLPTKRTIVTAHDGNVKSSFSHPLIARLLFKLAYGRMRFINMFSISEMQVFTSRFPGKHIFQIPLGMKDFGKTHDVKKTKEISLLFFGSIVDNKGVDILIKAANRIHETGLTGFKIRIHGNCQNWVKYDQLIKYPEIFEIDIRRHESSEIATLFSESHYAVYPYSEVSQSGALKVAFNYNIPAIVSDLDAFTAETSENENGFLFKANSICELSAVMQRVIVNHHTEYHKLVLRTKSYNQLHFSNTKIAASYTEMFNKIIQNSFGNG